jgi:hypothetical protein
MLFYPVFNYDPYKIKKNDIVAVGIINRTDDLFYRVLQVLPLVFQVPMHHFVEHGLNLP